MQRDLIVVNFSSLLLPRRNQAHQRPLHKKNNNIKVAIKKDKQMGEKPANVMR